MHDFWIPASPFRRPKRDSCKRCSRYSLYQNAMLFEFYEKLINASSQTISSWFDYNSHDMLNKLDKFSRNKLRSKNSNLNIAYYFFHRYRDIGKKN